MAIKFRPHHMLCTRFFEGKGYSKDFVVNMTNILNSLDNNRLVEIVKGKDDLCKCCPRFNDDKCDDYLKTDKYDELTLKELNLHYGDVINYKEFIKTYDANNMIEKICIDCSWYSICHKDK